MSHDETLQRRLAPWMHRALGERFLVQRLVGFERGVASLEATTAGGDTVLVRLLLPDIAQDPRAVARFAYERQVLEGVEHGALMARLDQGFDAGAPWMAQELSRGRTTREIARSRVGNRLAMHEVAAIVDGVLDALVTLHARGVVHASLRPDKILLDERGVRLVDFSSARRAGLAAPVVEGAGSNRLGAPAYMAPELARGDMDDVDARTDVWALGATAFTLLAGRPVHDAPSPNRQLLLAATTPAPALAGVAPDVIPALCAVVDRALAFDRATRWPDAMAMRTALAMATAHIPRPSGGGAWLPSHVELADESTQEAPAPRPIVQLVSPEPTLTGPALPVLGPAGQPLPFRLGSTTLAAASLGGRAPRGPIDTGTLTAGDARAFAALPFANVDRPPPQPSPPPEPLDFGFEATAAFDGTNEPDDDSTLTGVRAEAARSSLFDGRTMTGAHIGALGSPLPFDPRAPASLEARATPVALRGVGSGTIVQRPSAAKLPFFDESARSPLVMLPAPADPAAEPELAAAERWLTVRLALWAGSDRPRVLAQHGLDEVGWRDLDRNLEIRLERDAELGRAALALRLADRLALARAKGSGPDDATRLEPFLDLAAEVQAAAPEAVPELLASRGLSMDDWRATLRRWRLRAQRDPMLALRIRTQLARRVPRLRAENVTAERLRGRRT